MLIEKLRADSLDCRKARNDVRKAALLSTLIGEATKIGKDAGNREPTDEEVIKTIKKFADGAKFTIHKTVGIPQDNAKHELAILQTYLPTTISIDQIVSEIKGLGIDCSVPKNVGVVMKAMKERHGTAVESADIKVAFDSLK